MAKTSAQIEKRKRETEKRKRTEKVILKIAAAMPDDPVEQALTSSSIKPKAAKHKT